MSRLAFGFWTCAAIYAATGAFGIFRIGAGPSGAFSSDGYGTIGTMAAKETVLRPQRSSAPTPLDASGEH